LIRKRDDEIARKQEFPSAEPAAAQQRTISEAVERFLSIHGQIDQNRQYRGDSEHGTFRKYRGCLRRLESFCAAKGFRALGDVGPDKLEDFRATRRIQPVTWKVERQMLVTFFGHCLSRKWITLNPAKELRAPRNLKPNEVIPYTLEHERQIREACPRIGGGKYNRSGAHYEQLRALAMVLLLEYTALRISDVATFPKEAISWDETTSTWRIFLRTQKTGEPVFLPIPESLKVTLDAVPLPRNAPHDCPYYFWNGTTSRRAVVGIAERTLAAVFKKSGVEKAHAHRYRHTLATRMLAQGNTFELVADILGNTPEMVRKHYGKWAKGGQEIIDWLIVAHF
jgi:site-specific recombinase XerD